MKIVVTGANGQLGSEIKRLANNQATHQFIFTDREELDITKNEELVTFFSKERPEIVINCAAYTQVDQAEIDQENATLLNITAVENLSALSARNRFFLAHISTDYVFDGKSHTPIKEDHSMAPESFYGLSKASGEVQMRLNANHGAIIRTSWLYSSFGQNFVKTMLRLRKEKDTIRVVCDQIGTPTYAADLANFILMHLEEMYAVNGVETYHFSNSGVASWYDFAHAIFEIKNIPVDLIPIVTEEYPTLAPRPSFSVLDKTKISERFQSIPRHWKKALEDCLKR
ncbi:MAG: dTDP-4-dehydrorhamnose reductase [Bacteroidales bacterium]|jgi:dTDP-4-dehydrorhamnose reductase|nr:dTDP-4-dehydrorhamnose reductase [Bacteroidales bacterium]